MSGTRFFVGPDSQPDKYRLRAQVGGGGEATLWKADVTVAGAPESVAVKVLRPGHAGGPRAPQRAVGGAGRAAASRDAPDAPAR